VNVVRTRKNINYYCNQCVIFVIYSMYHNGEEDTDTGCGWSDM